jgi:hypothetical protein
MLPIPNDILELFDALMEEKAVPPNTFSNGVYTRCVPSRTVKEAKSPLDF